MKRVGYLFEKTTSFENLYESFKKAYKGSGRTREACRFYFHLEKELFQLQEELQNGVYQPARYRYFKIFDPKERTISVAPFRDRVVHHAVVRVLNVIFEPVFIYDSYATRKGKGTHKAINRAQQFLKQNPFYLKMDVARFFFSVDHDILLTQIERKIKDHRFSNLIKRIIRNSDVSRDLHEGKGLPIGNLTSQFFANVYLDSMDHFIKDEMGINGYVRYMDDIVIFSGSKERLKEIKIKVETYLTHRLELKLNPRATMLNHRLHGLPFLGFRIFPNLIRVKKENIKRMKKRIEKRKLEFRNGLITEDRFVMSIRSMFEHIGHANSFNLRKQHLISWAGVV